jgi:hypothetical protein
VNKIELYAELDRRQAKIDAMRTALREADDAIQVRRLRRLPTPTHGEEAMKTHIYVPLVLLDNEGRYSASRYAWGRRIPAMHCRDDAVTFAGFMDSPAVVVRQSRDNDSQRIDESESVITDVVGLAKPIDLAPLVTIARTDFKSLRLWIGRPGEMDMILFPNAPLTCDTERGTLAE